MSTYQANQATDTTPVVSPDGEWLAYTAMARPTYEADRLVVQLRNLRTGQIRALTQAWDRSVGSVAWAADGRSLLVTAHDTLDMPLFRVSRDGASHRRLIPGRSARGPLTAGRSLHVNSCRRPTLIGWTGAGATRHPRMPSRWRLSDEARRSASVARMATPSGARSSGLRR